MSNECNFMIRYGEYTLYLCRFKLFISYNHKKFKYFYYFFSIDIKINAQKKRPPVNGSHSSDDVFSVFEKIL